MGSFNEICALSGLSISWGTPVKLIFLTRNPCMSSMRGCYHYDQWFVRTPPISGEYDDYGRVLYKDGPIPQTIAKVFDEDVIEIPFGFNQYHDLPVFKGMGTRKYLDAALKGRLFVRDNYVKHKTVPESWPTWEKIFAILKKESLPIQHKELDAGYSAVSVIPGIVCVFFNSYDDNVKELEKVKKILSNYYDCRIVKHHIQEENYLNVTLKGAFDNPALLSQEYMTDHLYFCGKKREIPELQVMAVMIREDVWKEYCSVKHKKLKSVEEIVKVFRRFKFDMELSGVVFRLPFQTNIVTHLNFVKDRDKDDLLQACAELTRVEHVMAVLHNSWHIPSYGGQDSEWKLRAKLMSKLVSISKNEFTKE